MNSHIKHISSKKDTLTERRLDGKTVYTGKILTLDVDRVSLPSGGTSYREVIRHDPAVGIIAENSRGEYLMIRQFRYAVGRILWEIPAGLVETGEEYSAAAERELQEETGWKPGSLQELFRFFPSPGFSTEELILYHATKLIPSALPKDEDEFIEPVFLSCDELRRLLNGKNICDGKTLLALYWLLAKRGYL